MVYYDMQKINLEQDCALLLTATIDPKGMPNAFPSQINQREEQYSKALKYYIENLSEIQKFIFVENSGFPLNKLSEIVINSSNDVLNKVEFISLNCNNYPREFGKFYGELMLIEKALEKSAYLQEVSYFAKVTGKLKLINLIDILKELRSDYDFFCDFKDHGWMIKRLLGNKFVRPHCDIRFFVSSIRFFKSYLKTLHYNHKSGGLSGEIEFRRILNALKNHEKIMIRLPLEPDFRGIAGHSLNNSGVPKKYDSRLERNKFFIRSLIRKVLPCLHF